MNFLEINMTDFKIGAHVYEIFDPRNNGLVIQLGIDDVIVETRKREGILRKIESQMIIIRLSHPNRKCG